MMINNIVVVGSGVMGRGIAYVVSYWEAFM